MIVLAGSAVENETFRDEIYKELKDLCNIAIENNKVQAAGASFIAKDIYYGAEKILGMDVYPKFTHRKNL